ncbi:YnfU family zinc-binding protein [Erwinia pyri]|uniref:YnfU family zinc-binding protein n=1 Tax=Erwinia pyri TaxID=3062598 RepID=A0AA50HKP4_9GAMM|nr:YnfU family zinc-binding protein [Erwinia sp. DE2]WLS77226.1 YnfU family zinc-binding protein [Erwinia sp. DE2]
MSYFNRVMDRIARITSDTSCPVCGKKSKQSLSKQSHEKTMICPHCKSLFVIHW